MLFVEELFSMLFGSRILFIIPFFIFFILIFGIAITVIVISKIKGINGSSDDNFKRMHDDFMDTSVRNHNDFMKHH